MRQNWYDSFDAKDNKVSIQWGQTMSDGSNLSIYFDRYDREIVRGIEDPKWADGDLRRSLQKYSYETWGMLTAKDLMIKDPITISYKAMGTEALKLMEKNRKKPISILPVTDDLNKVIGILKLHDLLQEGIK